MCHLLQNHDHSVIQNNEGKHSKVIKNISRISFVVIRDLLNFGIQLFLFFFVSTLLFRLLLIKSLKFIVSSLFVDSYSFEMAKKISLNIYEISYKYQPTFEDMQNATAITLVFALLSCVPLIYVLRSCF